MNVEHQETRISRVCSVLFIRNQDDGSSHGQISLEFHEAGLYIEGIPDIVEAAEEFLPVVPLIVQGIVGTLVVDSSVNSAGVNITPPLREGFNSL